MATVQSELLSISHKIVTCEPVIVTASRFRSLRLWWANLDQFSPGLSLDATVSHDGSFEPQRIHTATFRVIEPGLGETIMTVSGNERNAEAYENSYAAYILEQFEQYTNRPNALDPAGLAGLVAVAELIG